MDQCHARRRTWANGNTLNLTFAGYDITYSADIGNHRTLPEEFCAHLIAPVA